MYLGVAAPMRQSFGTLLHIVGPALRTAPREAHAIAAAYALTQDFAAMLRERHGERPDAWLAQAEGAPVSALRRRFAIGLRADPEAARAGLTAT
jgi:hypothetical protein